MLLLIIVNNKVFSPFLKIPSTNLFKSEEFLTEVFCTSIIISFMLKRFASGLRLAISIITTPFVFFFKFLDVISSLVISLTVIFKVSISVSFLTVLVFFSLNS